jgi:hypothetical protein
LCSFKARSSVSVRVTPRSAAGVADLLAAFTVYLGNQLSAHRTAWFEGLDTASRMALQWRQDSGPDAAE